MKKSNFVILICLLILSAVFLSSCQSKAPALEDIKASLAEKIEKSSEVNEIFWGEGLPVVKIGSGEAMDRNLYNDQNDIDIDDDGFWEYVHPEKSKYHSVYDIKLLAESVYSRAFLRSVYEAQFEGVESAAYEGKSDPHYKEENYMLWKNTEVLEKFKLIDKVRVFDFDTMKIEGKSTEKRIYVSLDSHLEGENTVTRITLVFDLQDGEYYLSSPSY